MQEKRLFKPVDLHQDEPEPEFLYFGCLIALKHTGKPMTMPLKALHSLNLVLIILAIGCVSPPVTLDARYEFPQFEVVESFPTFNLDSWQSVDSQSLLINTSPSRSYLVILKGKSHDLQFAESIELTTTGPTVHAKFDCVKVKLENCSHAPIPISISRIYRLHGKEDITQAKQQIRAQP